ncbi:MAG: sulfur carrier protein ThiS [Gammaproteobacteria bacterium]|nr:sulfur carrier protein ThiS [Gammaproteobacteria bacterium]MDE2345520.1 sulfur carrier protein ThiS [Gammaproteobacteria bacterium]
MQITVNGKPAVLPESSTAQELIQRLELSGKRIALEVNGTIVPRSTYHSHQFHEGDHVEVVHAIGGG